MKKNAVIWTVRVLCILCVIAAAVTLTRCLIHMNDDHSREALLGPLVTPSPAPQPAEVSPGPELPESDVDENPTVQLFADSTATVNHPTVTVTASFGDIVNNIRAKLSWYVDGELQKEQEDCLLVAGSTMSYAATVEITEDSPEKAEVRLEVSFQDKTVDAETTFEVEPLGGSILVQTEEITVTALRTSDLYEDSELDNSAGGTIEENATGLLLAYETNQSGVSVLKIKVEGQEVWVRAENMQVTEEDCTTDEDYTDEQKANFVNSMNYDSQTTYLVWVSLYTQKVNIFRGYQGNWALFKSFDCASGLNKTPTTTGVFSIQGTQERWDLGATYVSPVLVFNGGEAFTSQPYDEDTGEVADDTMGKPASGGGVRLVKKDIEWMAENLLLNTLVVVY